MSFRLDRENVNTTTWSFEFRSIPTNERGDIRCIQNISPNERKLKWIRKQEVWGPTGRRIGRSINMTVAKGWKEGRMDRRADGTEQGDRAYASG